MTELVERFEQLHVIGPGITSDGGPHMTHIQADHRKKVSKAEGLPNSSAPNQTLTIVARVA